MSKSLADMLYMQKVFSDLEAYLSPRNAGLTPKLLNSTTEVAPFEEMLKSIHTLSGALNALYNGYRVLKQVPTANDYEENTPEYACLTYIQDLHNNIIKIHAKREALTKDFCRYLKNVLRVRRWKEDVTKDLREKLEALSAIENPNNLQREINLISAYEWRYRDNSPTVVKAINEFKALNEELLSGLMPLRRKMLADFGFKESFEYLIQREYDKVA